jgi:hypothetical protein
LTVSVILERSFVDGDASPSLVVGRGHMRGDGCGRGLAQQWYKFDVECRLDGPKVQQDGVFAYAADHGRIQPSQHPQQGLRLESCVVQRYGGIESESMPIANPAPLTKRSLKIVPALCFFVASLAILTFGAYPLYVIQPFREQRPAALERALWVLLHDKAPSLIPAAVATEIAIL